MSDTSQGEGWWQASDGKWYAPHLHPDVRDSSESTDPSKPSDPTTEKPPAPTGPMAEVGMAPAPDSESFPEHMIPTIAGAAAISTATEQAARAAAARQASETTPPTEVMPSATGAADATSVVPTTAATTEPDATAVVPAFGAAAAGVAGAGAIDAASTGSRPPVRSQHWQTENLRV